jgi:phosphotransferase system  glucose/maltose/N-acetylglucosamine-specific IIC component
MYKKNKFDFNLFDNERKSIPKTLEECHNPSKLVVALRKYAWGITRLGLFLGIIVLVLGLFDAISSSLIYEVSVYGEIGDVEDFDIANFLIVLVTALIEIFVIDALCTFLSVLLSALANLVYNNSVTANVALYQAQKQSESDKNQEA